jgi:hypothetical protein
MVPIFSKRVPTPSCLGILQGSSVEAVESNELNDVISMKIFVKF